MRNLLIAAAAVAVLAACDPTQKEDMSCTYADGALTVCGQLRITSAEGIVAKDKCASEFSGSWSTNPCSSTSRVPGYCKIEASQYSLSGTDVKLYFYDPATLLEAQAACTSASGTWISG